MLGIKKICFWGTLLVLIISGGWRSMAQNCPPKPLPYFENFETGFYSSNVYPLVPPDTTFIYAENCWNQVCIGEPFEGYGFTVQAQNTAGIYTFTRTECTNTTSILHELTLTVLPEMHTTLFEYISPDESVYHDGVAYSSPGDYTFTYTSSNGCDSVVELHILYHPDEIPHVTVWLPNAFTPNKPTLNNVFRPVFNYPEEIETYSIEIYNRWGGLVFRTEELSFG